MTGKQDKTMVMLFFVIALIATSIYILFFKKVSEIKLSPTEEVYFKGVRGEAKYSVPGQIDNDIFLK